MVVVVNQPHINEFRIEGTLSSTFLDTLKKEFGNSMRIERTDDDDWVNVTELEWYKEELAKETPGGNLRFYRKLAGLTQKELAEKLNSTKQHVSDMERNKRAMNTERCFPIQSLSIKSNIMGRLKTLLVLLYLSDRKRRREYSHIRFCTYYKGSLMGKHPNRKRDASSSIDTSCGKAFENQAEWAGLQDLPRGGAYSAQPFNRRLSYWETHACGSGYERPRASFL